MCPSCVVDYRHGHFCTMLFARTSEEDPFRMELDLLGTSLIAALKSWAHVTDVVLEPLRASRRTDRHGQRRTE